MPITIETREEFLSRHGGKNSLLKVGHRWLMPTGAAVSNSGTDPLLHEPPDDPSERLHVQREYREAKLEQLESDFRKLKAALLGETDENGMGARFRWPDDGRYGPPHPTGKEALIHLRKLVLAERDAIEKINAEIDELPESVAERERADEQRRIDAQIAEREAREQSEIQAIEI